MFHKDIVTKYLVNRKKNQQLFFIGIGGNIASGKSTFANELKKQILATTSHEVVEILSTDDFLLTNHDLQRLAIFNEKGWKISYDLSRITAFFSELRLHRESSLNVTYSQTVGDIIPCYRKITQPTILILEGTMVFTDLFSEIIDIFCYLDVDLTLNFQWYLERSLATLSEKKDYQDLTPTKALSVITDNWQSINMAAYQKYILPYKQSATIIIRLDGNHQVEEIYINEPS